MSAPRSLAVRLRGAASAVLVALVVAAPAVAATPAAPRAITLDEAMTMAGRMSPAMIQALGQSRIANSQVRASWGAFIPTLSVSSNVNRSYPSDLSTRVIDGQVVILPPQPWSFGASFSSNLTLFDGGRRFFDMKQARARSRTPVPRGRPRPRSPAPAPASCRRSGGRRRTGSGSS